MNVIWDESPLTSSEIFERLAAGGTEWSPKTVNTFLSRLSAKGALGVRKRSSINFYTPALSREECIRSEGASFLRRVFRGATGALVAHFCEAENLTDSELAELEKMIAHARKERKSRK